MLGWFLRDAFSGVFCTPALRAGLRSLMTEGPPAPPSKGLLGPGVRYTKRPPKQLCNSPG
jgi:hypothetical protein